MRESAREEAGLPLEQIVARDPATALYLPLAEQLLERGRMEEAIRLCEERRTRPGAGVGDRIVLGRAYLADGRLAEATAQFEAALALDRENVVALKALAGILSHQGDHPQATSYYRAVCRVDPGDLESQTALHQITSGEFPEARPADVIVGQGELMWQPVGLPREEAHLPELGLGLHTIETFEALRTIETFEAPDVPVSNIKNVTDFQEFSLERLDAPKPAPAPAPVAAEAPAPAADPPAALGALPEPPPAPAELPVPQAVDAPIAAPEPRVPPPAAAPTASIAAPAPRPLRADPGEPTPEPESAPQAPVKGNRSAFELWLRRLGGKED